jgi:hypothetical protein
MFDDYFNSDKHNKVPLTIRILTDRYLGYSLNVKIQFLHYKEQRLTPLEKPNIGKCCLRK